MDIAESIEEIEDDRPYLHIQQNHNIKNYITTAFLIIFAQLIYSAYTFVSLLYVKNDNIDIIYVIFFRGLISSIVTQIIAFCTEGQVESAGESYFLYLYF